MKLTKYFITLFTIFLFLAKTSYLSAGIVDNVDDEVKYGVLYYEYNNIKNYKPKNVNTGDYIQSLAAMQFLPKGENLELVPRDSYSNYRGLRLNLIMNGWYFLNSKNAVIPENINPIFVSLHISNPEAITQSYIDNLKKYQPIGCRDYYTQSVLSNYGLKTYFSGCLTTTLDIMYKAPENERTNNIIFCDYELGDYTEADKYLQTLVNYYFSKIIFTQHGKLSKTTPCNKCFDEARSMLKLYARAKLVVTTRLHCALPCLALGTPVIFINKHYDYKRFPGLYELLNTIGIDKDNKFKINVQKDINGNIKNPETYKKYAESLKKTVIKKIMKTK